jgi:hypothetical protein
MSAKLPPLVGIREVRKAQKMSVAVLMDRIREQGYDIKDPSTVRNIELGHKKASRPLMYTWAKALGLNPMDVIQFYSDEDLGIAVRAA